MLLEIAGGVFYGQLLDHNRVLKLENLKSKTELISDLAIMVKKVDTPCLVVKIDHLDSSTRDVIHDRINFRHTSFQTHTYMKNANSLRYAWSAGANGISDELKTDTYKACIHNERLVREGQQQRAHSWRPLSERGLRSVLLI